MSTSARLVDFAREDVDIALRFGGGQYPGPARAADVQAEGNRRGRAGAAEARAADQDVRRSQGDTRCCTTTRIAPGRAGWMRWARKASIRAAASSAAIATRCWQATLDGQGVGITSEVFAAGELQAGRLVKVFDAEVNATFGIYAVCLPRRLNDPLIAGTMDWLVREAQSVARRVAAGALTRSGSRLFLEQLVELGLRALCRPRRLRARPSRRRTRHPGRSAPCSTRPTSAGTCAPGRGLK